MEKLLGTGEAVMTEINTANTVIYRASERLGRSDAHNGCNECLARELLCVLALKLPQSATSIDLFIECAHIRLRISHRAT